MSNNPLHVGICSVFGFHRSCTFYPNYGKFILSDVLFCLKVSISVTSSNILAPNLFLPTVLNWFMSLGRGCSIYSLFRASNSSISYSLNLDLMCHIVLISIYSKSKTLTAFSVLNLYSCINTFWCPCFKNSVAQLSFITVFLSSSTHVLLCTL